MTEFNRQISSSACKSGRSRTCAKALALFIKIAARKSGFTELVEQRAMIQPRR
jgi:hypothetical protein